MSAKSQAGAPPAQTASVLVVDDRPANLIAMRALLRADAVEVLTASSAEEALELLLGHDVAVALLDVQMPVIDGFTLAAMMRSSQRTRSVPIIFLTAGAQEAGATFQGYERGAVDFLHKPVDERVLRSKVQVFVELQRQRRALAEHGERLSRLMQANALLVGSLSHELQEPLAAVALNAELIAQRAGSPALADAARRQKAAVAELRRHLDHLLNLAMAPRVDVTVRAVATDVAGIARRCWEAARADGDLQVLGDTRGSWDPELLTTAVCRLFDLARDHGDGRPLAVLLDGTSRRCVRLQVTIDQPLSEAAAAELLGPQPADGESPIPPGPALEAVDRIARAHGGSLVARSRRRTGTCFELLLPRAGSAAEALPALA